MKELSVEDQIYLCKYHDVDKDLKFTIGLNENEVKENIQDLESRGYFEEANAMKDLLREE